MGSSRLQRDSLPGSSPSLPTWELHTKDHILLLGKAKVWRPPAQTRLCSKRWKVLQEDWLPLEAPQVQTGHETLPSGETCSF